ncbi:hypothetical protein V8D89_006635 [Ganoderma adspersum]
MSVDLVRSHLRALELRLQQAQGRLHDHIIQPCTEEVTVEQSTELITEPSFQIKRSVLLMASIRKLMSPTTILSVIKEKALFTYQFLHAFTTAPNKYRKKKVRATGVSVVQDAGMHMGLGRSEVVVGLDESEKGDNGEPETPDEALRLNNCILAPVIMVVICMCLFVYNRATNVLTLPLGLFLKISGTSECVLILLSNIGLSVSSTTIEHMKEHISDDTVQLAVSLIMSSTQFYIIFDNINLYLQKFQERIYNWHSMIYATNAAVIAISEGDPAKVENLASKLEHQEKRVQAK